MAGSWDNHLRNDDVSVEHAYADEHGSNDAKNEDYEEAMRMTLGSTNLRCGDIAVSASPGGAPNEVAGGVWR